MNREKGFTILEIVIAIGVAIILAVGASIYLLHHIERAIISTIASGMDNIRVAFASAYTTGLGIDDVNGDGDYLDDIIRMGFLSNFSPYPKCSVWKVEKDVDINGRKAYYLRIDLTACRGEFYMKMLNEIDKAIDDGNRDTGIFRHSIVLL
ncbi:MAG: prepilin-type N-terminal cleavage/methylation domain-containing protein [Thermoproteota archaeon]